MKTTITMLFMLLLTVQLPAQEWNFGIKGGVNIANFTGSDADDLDLKSRTGFHLGGLVEGKFSESFGAQLEVLYSTAGAKVEGIFMDDMGNEFDGDITFKLDYISVPVLFKYFPIQELSIETGPQISFETSSEVEAEAMGESVSLDFEDETSSVEFGWLFGLGYDLPYNIFVQARYLYGLSDVYDESNLKHSVFQISLGYKF
ncbi:porin family protein [Salinimicrobium sp. TH3]|uniref:porin family protein n=1 Tax=Salinimicrobium sp. TH3 TaxID=2997342 RepID=UPI0022766AAF|nr:porin family protein [Salinimicrobium sp. TH3]MCY2685975.1 porin family protein [Salinimicrobium sp. TH3]